MAGHLKGIDDQSLGQDKRGKRHSQWNRAQPIYFLSRMCLILLVLLLHTKCKSIVVLVAGLKIGVFSELYRLVFLCALHHIVACTAASLGPFSQAMVSSEPFSL